MKSIGRHSNWLLAKSRFASFLCLSALPASRAVNSQLRHVKWGNPWTNPKVSVGNADKSTKPSVGWLQLRCTPGIPTSSHLPTAQGPQPFSPLTLSATPAKPKSLKIEVNKRVIFSSSSFVQQRASCWHHEGQPATVKRTASILHPRITLESHKWKKVWSKVSTLVEVLWNVWLYRKSPTWHARHVARLFWHRIRRNIELEPNQSKNARQASINQHRKFP